MWKTQVAPILVKTKDVVSINNDDEDDWNTDADFVNNVSEKEQRWGSKTVAGSGRQAYIDIDKLREEVQKVDKETKKKEYEKSAFSVGYGGKFGVQEDRVDKSAVGFDYHLNSQKHTSQVDYAKGFGGKFGIQEDRKDKSAVGFDHVENLQKHESQIDYAKGFGGKYGVQNDRKDKSAVGFDHVEKLNKHESQVDYVKGFGGRFGLQEDRKDKSAVGFEHVEIMSKHSSQIDYSKGFGGKYGVQKDRKDKSALGFEHVEQVPKHSSQQDYSKGFGGKFGVQEDRKDKSALKFDDNAGDTNKIGTNYQPVKVVPKSDLKNIKARFENRQMDTNAGEMSESQKRIEELRLLRLQNKSEPDIIESSKRVINNNQIKKESDKVSVDIINQNDDSNDDWNDSKQVEITPVYVEQSKSDDNQAANSTAFVEYSAVAAYDYDAQDTDEISFKVNDTITNIEKIDDGWWRGVCNQRYGLFPANYVQIID